MNLDYLAITASLESHALTLGVFDSVNDHPPIGAPPGTEVTCYLWLDDVTPVPGFSGLNATAAQVVVAAQILKGAQALPLGGIDPAILVASNALVGAYTGAFTLDGNVSYVDVMRLRQKANWLRNPKDGGTYRVVDITIPMTVDSVWIQAA